MVCVYLVCVLVVLSVYLTAYTKADGPGAGAGMCVVVLVAVVADSGDL